jgi:hypothetical protein
MIREIITHLLAALLGGLAVKFYYNSHNNKHKGDNVASNGSVIANAGSNISNCGNIVNNNIVTKSESSDTPILSDQAKDILKQFLGSDEPSFYFLSYTSDVRNIKQISLHNGTLKISDTITIEEDLDDLVNLGYLKVEESPHKTTKIYKWTSKGRSFATELSKS